MEGGVPCRGGGAGVLGWGVKIRTNIFLIRE